MLFATGISDRASSGVSGEPWPVAIAMSQAWPAHAARAVAPAASAGAIGPCGSGVVTCAASPLAVQAGPDASSADRHTPAARCPADPRARTGSRLASASRPQQRPTPPPPPPHPPPRQPTGLTDSTGPADSSAPATSGPLEGPAHDPDRPNVPDRKST